MLITAANRHRVPGPRGLRDGVVQKRKTVGTKILKFQYKCSAARSLSVFPFLVSQTKASLEPPPLVIVVVVVTLFSSMRTQEHKRDMG